MFLQSDIDRFLKITRVKPAHFSVKKKSTLSNNALGPAQSQNKQNKAIYPQSSQVPM